MEAAVRTASVNPHEPCSRLGIAVWIQKGLGQKQEALQSGVTSRHLHWRFGSSYPRHCSVDAEGTQAETRSSPEWCHFSSSPLVLWFELSKRSKQNTSATVLSEGVRMWCLECQSLTTDERCVVQHSFCSLQRVVNEATRDVGVMLEAFAVVLQGALKNLQVMRECVNAATARQDPAALQACAASADRAWDAVQQALRQFGEQARQRQAAECQAATDEEGWKTTQQATRLPEVVVVGSMVPAKKEKELGETVAFLCSGDPAEKKDERAVALACLRRQGVQRLAGLLCKRQPVFVLDVLRCASPTLSELELVFPREEHIQAAHSIPGLRRLRLFVLGDEVNSLVLPGLSRPGSLQWLMVYGMGLPWPTLVSLLKAHRTTLDVLWLWVGTAPREGEGWPVGVSGLDGVLEQCSLRLSRIVLGRDWFHCTPAACSAQLTTVRRVLPNAIVQCCHCDQVEVEAF